MAEARPFEHESTSPTRSSHALWKPSVTTKSPPDPATPEAVTRATPPAEQLLAWAARSDRQPPEQWWNDDDDPFEPEPR